MESLIEQFLYRLTRGEHGTRFIQLLKNGPLNQCKGENTFLTQNKIKSEILISMKHA